MNTKSLITIDVILLALAILLGGLLLFSNRHYNIAVFTIHKLSALGAVVLTVILYLKNMKDLPLAGILLVCIIAAVISVIALFITGALLSTGHSAYSTLKTIHCIASILLAASEAGIILRVLRL